MEDMEKLIQAGEDEWKEGWKRGPQHTRWTQIPLQVQDQAPDFDLLDQDGNTVKLSQYWQDKPALIIFWRHYGCGCGIDRAKRLNDELVDYEKAGVNIVVIGQGEPGRAAAYAEKYALPNVPVLCDPAFQVYTAYGLVEGKTSQILFDAPHKFLDRDSQAGLVFAKERKELGRPLVDNAWLLPGEFVVDTHGEIRLAYRYNYCEDFPDHRVHIAAIRESHLAAK
ncbi:MAG: AhpC/TSA family protein [Chloroflexota bacterium]